MGFAPQVEPFTSEADAAASDTPVLDVLTRLEELGVDLLSDGDTVWFAPGDWRRVPDDVLAAARQCKHSLARLLGDTRQRCRA